MVAAGPQRGGAAGERALPGRGEAEEEEGGKEGSKEGGKQGRRERGAGSAPFPCPRESARGRGHGAEAATGMEAESSGRAPALRGRGRGAGDGAGALLTPPSCGFFFVPSPPPGRCLLRGLGAVCSLGSCGAGRGAHGASVGRGLLARRRGLGGAGVPALCPGKCPSCRQLWWQRGWAAPSRRACAVPEASV